MKIGIYGGAFNPVHYGHLRTAEDTYELLSLDKVIFMPSGRTPFDKPDLISAAHRYQMVKKAVRGSRHFSVSDIEVKTRGRSYTVDTIKKLHKAHAGSELYFILGIDAFLDVPAWKEPDRLMELAHLIIISRPGYTFADLRNSPFLRDISLKTLRQVDSEIMPSYSFAISRKRRGILCRVTEMNISATLIRDRIKSGHSVRYLLPDSVKSYIISNNLYRIKEKPG